ncbi:MAG: Uma2 family endonuclease [Pseudomonadota bacterium]
MSRLDLEPEHYTVEDYQHWEGDWELIEGHPYAMSPAPVVAHQQLAAGLFQLLAEALDPCPACQALYECDVQFSNETIVRPDLLVVCYPPEGANITRAPELIIEIISPRRARHDEHTKFMLYQAEGVEYYLLAYPDERKVKVYRLIDGAYRKLGDFFDDPCRIHLSKCTLELRFDRAWRRLSPPT